MITNRVPFVLLVAVFPFAASLPAQERFDSPDAAAHALLSAASAHDHAALETIFGKQAGTLLSSGNPAQDASELSEFAKLAQAKHQLEPDTRNPNRVILSIGDQDWPFPVPIVRTNGKWSFDSSETEAEMQARRIGTHELDAVEICAGYVEAQQKFAALHRAQNQMNEYAARAISTPGHDDGLYSENNPHPLVPKEFAQAVISGDINSSTAKPYHGYYFRILRAQGPNAPGGSHSYSINGKLIGGFGLVAWPARYGVTGIHTFIVNQDGIVYQKDIEPSTKGTPAIVQYDPDRTWQVVD